MDRKGVTPVSDLTNVIEMLQLRVECRHCGHIEEKTLSWLSARRDMNCCQCGGVIVLNTSERKREIAALRRQVESLHEQLADVMPAAHNLVTQSGRLLRAAIPSVRPELSLLHAYRETSGRAANRRR
jgi:ribosomal protein S27E